MENLTEIATGYFDVLMKQTDDERKQKQQALARTKVQRQFHSAHDDAATKELKLLESIDGIYNCLRSRPEDGIDVNAILDLKQKALRYKEVQESIKEGYKFLFGTELETSF